MQTLRKIITRFEDLILLGFARWISQKPSRNKMIFYVLTINYLDLAKIRLRLASFGYLSSFTKFCVHLGGRSQSTLTRQGT